VSRFVKEYANYKIKQLKANDLIQETIRLESIARIEHATKLFYQYMLSADEAMRIISES
jgi:hypothetical protein